MTNQHVRRTTPTGRATRLLMVVVLSATALVGLSACGKKPGDVLPPESVQDRDTFPRRYPSS